MLGTRHGSTPAGVDYQSTMSSFDINKVKEKGFTFGLSRAAMQKNPMEQFVVDFKQNPGPRYNPTKIGTRLGTDAVKFSIAHRLTAVEGKLLTLTGQRKTIEETELCQDLAHMST
jgi:hypothetical protein